MPKVFSKKTKSHSYHAYPPVAGGLYSRRWPIASSSFIYHRRNDGLWVTDTSYLYRSPRYGKSVLVKAGQVRDGASGAMDITSASWWVHDQLCADGRWLDGTDVTPGEAAMVLSDILKAEGRWFRAQTWKIATYFFGCKRAHLNLHPETDTES